MRAVAPARSRVWSPGSPAGSACTFRAESREHVLERGLGPDRLGRPASELGLREGRVDGGEAVEELAREARGFLRGRDLAHLADVPPGLGGGACDRTGRAVDEARVGLAE